jgi:glycosyltransferase involved in cell wall biosynthesis
VTRRVWGEAGPETEFETVAVAPGGELYARSGRRRIWPPIRFGIGVFWHMLRRGRDYDVVHCTSFPYFSLLGAWAALRLARSRARLVVDWHEVWGRGYWISYVGAVAGRIGYAVQRLCVRLPDHSFTFSRLHTERLVEEGHRAPVTRLTGEYEEAGYEVERSDEAIEPPLIVFAGRHIPEKHVPAVPGAIAIARAEVPELRCRILGSGPETGLTRRRIAELDLEGVVTLEGPIAHREVIAALAGASALLLPSEREGYGLVVVEAIAQGTPAIVARGPENAAVELIEPGVNGLVADSAQPLELAAAIVELVRAGAPMRASTREWYAEHARELSIESSLDAVEAAYASDAGSRPAG